MTTYRINPAIPAGKLILTIDRNGIRQDYLASVAQLRHVVRKLRAQGAKRDFGTGFLVNGRKPCGEVRQ